MLLCLGLQMIVEHNMPYKDKRSGKWVARVQVNNKRFRIGLYKTKKEAVAAEEKKRRELARLFNTTLEKQHTPYIQTDHPTLFTNLRKWLADRRAEKAKDKLTTEKLEQL